MEIIGVTLDMDINDSSHPLWAANHTLPPGTHSGGLDYLDYVDYTTTTRSYEDVMHEDGDAFFSTPLQTANAIASGLVFGAVILLTLVGNSLVICAVALFPRLRSTTNLFIVSLAIADLTVATLVMTFSLLYTVLQRWVFGWVFCYFWISCDVMCCTASILHLCVISVDRYIAITRPFRYKTIMSKGRAILLICGVWLCSGVISFMPIYLGWFADLSKMSLYVDSEECGLYVNKVYAVVSSSTSFYIPLFAMIVVYYKIYEIAREKAREITKLEITARDYGLESDARTQRKSSRLARDAKAIKTLGTLMGLFIACWLPFFLMYLILPFCGGACALPTRVEAVITWLGYCNSFINPFVYAWLNRDFRAAFKRLLCWRRYRGDRLERWAWQQTQGQQGGCTTPCLERCRTLEGGAGVGGGGGGRGGARQYSESEVSANSKESLRWVISDRIPSKPGRRLS